MKALFFIIAFANLVLWLWEYRTESAAQPIAVKMAGQATILLVGEGGGSQEKAEGQ